MANNNDDQFLRLEDYGISLETGFLQESPLERLPDYFNVWNEICADNKIEQLIEDKTLRDKIDEMPELEYRELKSESEYRLAYVFLCFMGNGYVWMKGDNAMARCVPRQLAIPWCGVSDYLGLKPCVSMTSVVLSNWKLIDTNGTRCADNMAAICNFKGRDQSAWFFIVSAQVELDFVPALKAIVDAKKALRRKDDSTLPTVRTSLDIMTTTIDVIKRTSKRMHERMPGSVFYNDLRPFLSGWNATGLIYHDVPGDANQPRKLYGGSAAQSSTIQCLDAALGITHPKEQQDYLDKMKEYMPKKHAQFLRDLWHNPSIRKYVEKTNDRDLTSDYDKCVTALRAFRDLHKGLVTTYILKQGDTELGTGGTELNNFLDGIRDSTVEHRFQKESKTSPEE